MKKIINSLLILCLFLSLVGCGANKLQDNKKCSHRYRNEITYPTCTEAGFVNYICNDCGHSYTEIFTEAKGHEYVTGSDYCAVCQKKK